MIRKLIFFILILPTVVFAKDLPFVGTKLFAFPILNGENSHYELTISKDGNASFSLGQMYGNGRIIYQGKYKNMYCTRFDGGLDCFKILDKNTVALVDKAGNIRHDCVIGHDLEPQSNTTCVEKFF